MIPNYKPFTTGKEIEYISEVLANKKLSGNGLYTEKCHSFFRDRYGFENCFLTTSCTDALEMCALLLQIETGDEIIVPSFTHVSTANAFVIHGAKLIFADSGKNTPCIDSDNLEHLITSKTKAIVVVHYAGISCDMDRIMAFANEKNLIVIEDAAHAIDGYWKSKNGNRQPLGSIGHLSTFSFHETKNIISGEGGMLVVNDKQFLTRAEILWEKGTNRLEMERGKIPRYEWVDKGSSFLPSELISATLFAQLESIEFIQKKRLEIWNTYHSALNNWSIKMGISLPTTSCFSEHNASIYFLVCGSLEQRNLLIRHLEKSGICAQFHFLGLHKSPYIFATQHAVSHLPNCERYEERLVRLPLFVDLTLEELSKIIQALLTFD